MNTLSDIRKELVTLATNYGIKVYSSLDEYILKHKSIDNDRWVYINDGSLEYYKEHANAFFERNHELIECITDNAMVCFKQAVIDSPMHYRGTITKVDLVWQPMGSQRLFNTYQCDYISAAEAYTMPPDVFWGIVNR